jgi:hypothetical protein
LIKPPQAGLKFAAPIFLLRQFDDREVTRRPDRITKDYR